MSIEYLFRVGFMIGDQGQPGFDPNTIQPYVLDRHIAGFELLRGFIYPVLIGMDVLSQCDLHVLRNGAAQIDLP